MSVHVCTTLSDLFGSKGILWYVTLRLVLWAYESLCIFSFMALPDGMNRWQPVSTEKVPVVNANPESTGKHLQIFSWITDVHLCYVSYVIYCLPGSVDDEIPKNSVFKFLVSCIQKPQ